jgi:mono/diheme cytochrome c family protein
MRKHATTYTLVSGIALMGWLLLISAGQFPEWVVPADQAAIANPVPSSAKALSSGRSFYEMQCKACHGPKGAGDGIIPSATLLSDAFQAQSDGAIFWKLQTGRELMPSFATQPADQLWEVIHYLRALAKPVSDQVKKKTLITLQTVDHDTVRRVIARAFEIAADGSRLPLSEKKIVLGVKRMFGVLPFSSNATYTNEEGRVSGVFPVDLPADTAGNVIIIAYIDDPAFESGTVEEHVPWGESWEFTDITKQRSLWARMKYAPIWLLISFTAVAGAIWLTILFVMLELKKINDQGKKFLKAQATNTPA